MLFTQPASFTPFSEWLSIYRLINLESRVVLSLSWRLKVLQCIDCLPRCLRGLSSHFKWLTGCLAEYSVVYFLVEILSQCTWLWIIRNKMGKAGESRGWLNCACILKGRFFGMSFQYGRCWRCLESSLWGSDGVEKTGLVPERRVLKPLAMLVSVFQ